MLLLHPALWFAGFSAAVSLAFFWEGGKTGYAALSGDQINILTICAKQDHPGLFQGDMVVGDPRSTAYYIPWFVKLVRVLSLPDHNYLRGLNWLLLGTSLIYFWGWWLLFSAWGDKWVAAVLAFLVRGIMWPPGNEVWGIAGLWTMLPRTLFLALLPWILWGWMRGRSHPWVWLVSFFGCGLLVNVHPISGACIVVALVCAEFVWAACERKSFKQAAVRAAIGCGLALLGMAPFVWTYLTKVAVPGGADPTELDHALRLRIRNYFFEPTKYFALWLRPQWIVLIVAPWLLFLLSQRKNLTRHMPFLTGMAAFELACVAVPLLSFPAEALLKSRGHSLHIAFQLVRSTKYVIVPSVLIGAMAVSLWAQRLRDTYAWGRGAIAACCALAILTTCLARSPVLDGLPVLADDVVRSLWPGYVAAELNPERRRQHFDEVLDWIREKTPPTAKFVGPREIRVVTLRSVTHDWEASGVVCEGNPKAFVEIAHREQEFRKAKDDPDKLLALLSSWGADYWVTTMLVKNGVSVFDNGQWRVYDLRAKSESRSVSLRSAGRLYPQSVLRFTGAGGMLLEIKRRSTKALNSPGESTFVCLLV
jgi:hypothetical protein